MSADAGRIQREREEAELKAVLEQIEREEAEERRKRLEQDTKAAQELAKQFEKEEEARRSRDRKRQEEAQASKTKGVSAASEELDPSVLLALQLQDQDRLQESSAHHNLDADYAFAWQTQFDLEKRGAKSLQQMTGDEELAAALQAIESSPASGLSDFEFYKQLQKRWEGKSAAERKAIEESIRNILDSPAVKGEYGADGTPILTDAHKYTSTLIRAGIPILTGIDDQFKLSSIELSPDKVLEEVLTFLEKDSKRIAESARHNPDFLRISIENIKKTFGHVKSNPAVEASETQANAHHLLSRTWILAKKMGTDYMAALATALSDNIGDGGSCIPGLIARLYARYAVMVAAQLGVEGSPRPGAPAKPPAK